MTKTKFELIDHNTIKATGEHGGYIKQRSVTALLLFAILEKLNEGTEKQPVKAKKKTTVKKATKIPDDFQIKQSTFDWLCEQGFTLVKDNKHPEELQKFIDYHKGNGKTMKDWDATFRNWMRNAERFYLDRNKQR